MQLLSEIHDNIASHIFACNHGVVCGMINRDKIWNAEQFAEADQLTVMLFAYIWFSVQFDENSVCKKARQLAQAA